ncbi:MAG: YggT family protein [Caulobacterales bacterium]
MGTLIDFLFLVLHYLLQAVIWVVIANAIMSWLIAFDVINMRNRIAYQVVHFLDAVTRPLLRPFRRFIPPLGGVDITPVILIILVEATDQVVLPAAYAWLRAHVG